MNFACKCLKKVEATDGDELVLGFPDETGQVISLKGSPEGNLDAIIPGAKYTLAFVPLVEQTNTVADQNAVVEAPSADVPVPADHPAVIDPASLIATTPAVPEEVIVSDPLPVQSVQCPEGGEVTGTVCPPATETTATPAPAEAATEVPPETQS